MKPKQSTEELNEGIPADAAPRDAASDATIVSQVYQRARAIPSGRVLSYGALGAQCEPPISGYICGRIMNTVLQDVPWWRVVAKDGSLPIAKRNAVLAQEQRQKLLHEGVEFDDESRVLMNRFSADIPDDEQNSLFAAE